MSLLTCDFLDEIEPAEAEVREVSESVCALLGSLADFAKKHGVSITVAEALIRERDIASDIWLAESGHTARPTERRRSAKNYARSNRRRERRSGGSRGDAFVAQEEWMMADVSSDPIEVLLTREAIELGEIVDDASEGWWSPLNDEATTSGVGKRRKQQLRAAQVVAIEAGQLGFSGFGFGACQ
jgi:hypothetical protein